jgi:hypothetical protein
MIVPGVFDMRMWQGTTWDYSLTWEDGNPPAAKNLTGYTARLQVRATADADDTVIDLDNLIGGNGGITLGGVAGTIALAMSATNTALVDPGWYVYDLELESSAGVVTRLLEGKFAVVAEVTR